MYLCTRMLTLCLLIPVAAATAGETASEPAVVLPDAGELPAKAANFLLLDHTGAAHELRREGVDAAAIVLYTQGNGCPIVRKGWPALKALRDEFAPKGVKFFMINANSQDARADVAEEAGEFGIDIPILLDESQMVVKTLGSVRTAEALLVDPSSWDIVYRGAVNDQWDYVGRQAEPQHEWLKDALNAFLAGEPVETARTITKGCLITFKPTPREISYQQDIIPILRDHCVTCHSPGNIGPFALSSHGRVEGWADMIREVVLAKQMPPWHADPHYGQFANDRGLAPEQTRTLLAWLDQGAPKDGEGDPLRDLMKPRTREWALGEPDLLVELPEEQRIPASGVFDYRYIEVPSGLTEDTWVRAIDVQSTNRKVTHHILVFLRYPPERAHLQPNQEGGLLGFFGGYIPGQEVTPFPENSGKWLPAGTTFVFQLHYNATGKEEVDHPRMALYFMEGEPERELVTAAAADVNFAILPGDPSSETQAKHIVTRDAVLYGLSPHMHYRGKRFRYEAQYPDGTRETLLSVPHYDFDWQTLYHLKEPKHLPAGTVVVAKGAFDNSKANPYNPDPTATVFFGEQTHEEMFIGYLHYTVDPAQEAMSVAGQRPDFEWVRLDAQTLVGTAWRMQQYLIAFEPEGKILVNNAIPGTWRIEGNEVLMDAAGRTMRFVINDDRLETRRGRRLERVS
jgi:peroxiredoxin